MNDEENELYNDLLNESNFVENITFTDENHLKNIKFEETLTFVKGFISSWSLSNKVCESQKNTPLHNSLLTKTQCFNGSTNNVSIPPLSNGIKTITRKIISHHAISNQQTDLKCWGLPPEIISKYHFKGVKNMFPWQVECLGNSRVLNDNGNLIYSAPTSAGKTLVAEILTIKTVLERQKKVMVILPFVSVVREKMFYFQDIFSESGIRVEGFMGSHSPPGGFQAIHIAICTIEKANSLVNNLLENGSIADLGAVIVDELHLLGDPHRGYILELLLTKLLYVTKRYEQIDIQIIGMSATLPNLSLLSEWLNADLYKTDFRPIPLEEHYHHSGSVYNCNMEVIRIIESSEEFVNDKDNIVYLCLETIMESCSVLVFCPTKNWCENLAQQIAGNFRSLGYSQSNYGKCLRKQLNGPAISEVLEQLKASPAGLDHVLHQTISFGVAFHHAGLTMDERDIIEGAFKSNVIRVLVSTSTLSSGVNLPARRVIIRSPTFHSRPINIQTYKQMVGRAGRMGIDTAGESILICSANDKGVAEGLICGTLDPISSCLKGGDKLLRAVLEAIASQVAKTPEDVQLFINCTLLLHSLEKNESTKEYSEETVKQLVHYELIRLQNTSDELFYMATPLGKACLSSSMSPQDGLTLFKELQKARECFVLETDLHMIYLVTPYSICSQWGDLNWMHLLNLWDGLSKAMKRVGEMVGIQESLIYRCMRGAVKMDSPVMQCKLQVLRRFYTALALQDLINEVPLATVSATFSCSRGMLQSLQQSAATFAGMVTAFSRQLGWKSFETLVSQFQDRLQFGIQSDLLDLMRLQSLNGLRARALFNAGIETICQLASADICLTETALYASVPFQSEKERDGEIKYDVDKRNSLRNIWITGKKGVTAKEAADLLILEARTYLQFEMGITEVKWELKSTQLAPSQNDNKKNLSVLSEQIKQTDQCISPNPGNYSNHHFDPVETPPPKTYVEDVMNALDIENTSSSQSLKYSTPIVDSILNIDLSVEQPKDDTNISIRDTSDLMFKDLTNTENDFMSPPKNCISPEYDFNIQDISIENNVASKEMHFESADVSYKSNCSILQSDHSKNLSMFEESIEIDTQLCGLLDNEQSSFVNNAVKDEFTFPLKVTEGESFKSNFTNNILSIENVFAVPFDESFADKICDSQKFSSADNVILSSQETSKYDLSVRNVKTVTPKRKLVRKEFKKSKKRKFMQDNIKKIDFIYGDSLNKPSNSKEIKIINHSSTHDNSNDEEIFTHKYILNYVEQGDHKVLEIEGFNSSTFEINTVNASKNLDLFKDYCSHILSFKKITLYIDMEIIENKTHKIGQNIVKNNGKTNQIASTERIYYQGKSVRGFVVFIKNSIAYYFEYRDNTSDTYKFLNGLVSEKERTITLFNSKYVFLALNKCCDIKIESNWEDPLVADWLLEPEGDFKTLPSMMEKYNSMDFKSLLLNKDYRDAACLNAWATCYITETLKNYIKVKHQEMLYTFGTEMKALRVIAECELAGMEVDKIKAGAMINRVKSTQTMLEKHAFKITGRRFRFTSSSEVAKILGLYKGHKVSTSKKTLEKIDNPLAQIVIYWRKLNAILTKNLFPLTAKAVENKTDTRIYSTYCTHTSTGRMSMQEPNLQSVPRNFDLPAQLLFNQIEDGEDISSFFSCRNIFPSASGTVLISADYCQLELRLLTHLSSDATLRKIVMSEGDIFKSIAATWKCISEDEVDDDLRQKAKQMCYGVIYGMGCNTLAQILDIPELEATVFMNSFHATYPAIQIYTNKIIQECRRLGYVETLSGRRRYLHLINSVRFSEKSHAERQAVNTTIQGSAADILKSAMILIHKTLEESFQKPHNIKLVLLLHDELMYEVPSEKVDRFKVLFRDCMENTVSLSVPLPVKVKIGALWGDLREVS